jgi:hypothetical protein
MVQHFNLKQANGCEQRDAQAQKPPRFPSTARVVELRLPRGLLRRAMLERSPSLLATGRKAFIE